MNFHEVTENRSNCLKAVCQYSREVPLYLRLVIYLCKTAKLHLRCHLGWNAEIMKEVMHKVVHFIFNIIKIYLSFQSSQNQTKLEKIIAPPNIDTHILV